MSSRFHPIWVLLLTLSLLAMPWQASAMMNDISSGDIQSHDELDQPKSHCGESQPEQDSQQAKCCCNDCNDFCSMGCDSHATASILLDDSQSGLLPVTIEVGTTANRYRTRDISPPFPPPLS